MVEAFAYDDLSLDDDVDKTEHEDVENQLAAQLAVAQSQRGTLEGLLKLEREALRWAAASIGLVLVALVALVLAGGGLLKSFPMAPLFLAPFLWQAFQTFRRKQDSIRSLLSLEGRLESAIRVAEDAKASQTPGR